MKTKVMKTLFVFGLGLGIATTASAGRFDNCNDLQFKCEVLKQTNWCPIYWETCLA